VRADRTRTRSDDRSHGSDLFYRIVVQLALIVFRLMRWRIVVSGEDAIPVSGPAVIASNHVSFVDFLFLGMAAHPRGRLVRFMALRKAFDHALTGPMMRWMRHIPVDRFGDPTPAYELAVRALRAGEVVGIHPEAKVNVSLEPVPAKSGAARMAIETGSPLIPAAVWGSQPILAPRGRPRFPRNVTIVVELGTPVAFDASTEPSDLTDRLMERIRALSLEAEARHRAYGGR
jgi:1-acyl-sn-glycerol-3-phosphate acyltransferase